MSYPFDHYKTFNHNDENIIITISGGILFIPKETKKKQKQ